MRTEFEKLTQAAANDVRLIFRDNSLKLFLALPLIALPVVRFAIPYVVEIYGFLQDLIPVILMLASMQGSVAFGFIYSMVLVDERDTSVSKVYGILPVSKIWLVVFRLIPPYFLAAVSTFLLVLVQPFYVIPTVSALVYSLLAATAAPLMTLLVATLSRNKIEALTYQKLSSIPLYIPIAAFFVPEPLFYFFGVFPTAWAYFMFNDLLGGNSVAPFAITGILYTFLLIFLAARRFAATHFV